MVRKDGKAFGPGRRSFLAMSVGGGLGALGLPHALAAQSAPNKPDTTQLPEGIVSPADSLVAFADLVKSVQFEAFRIAGIELLTATKNCSVGLKSLTDAVQDLEDALRKSKAEGSASALTAVRNLGNSSSDLLESANNAAASSQVDAATLTKNVCDAVEGIISEGKFSASPKVTKSLKELLCRARELRPVGQMTREAQVIYLKKTDEINKAAASIEEKLISASVYVTNALSTGATKVVIKTALEDALKETRDARAELSEFDQFALTLSTTDNDLPTRRVLLDALQGTSLWIEKMRDEKTARLDGAKGAGEAAAYGGARFENASLSSGGTSPAPDRCSLSYWDMRRHVPAVMGYLEQHCKPGTYARAILCISYAKPAWEQYCGRGERNGRIRTMGSMWLLACWGKGADKQRLIERLADHDFTS